MKMRGELTTNRVAVLRKRETFTRGVLRPFRDLWDVELSGAPVLRGFPNRAAAERMARKHGATHIEVR